MAQLTVRAAASRLGVGYSTLKQWIYQGRIRTTQTAGGHHRIPDAEIDRLTTRKTPTGSPGVRPSTTGLIVALSGRNRLQGFVEEVRIDSRTGNSRATGRAFHCLRIPSGIAMAVMSASVYQVMA